MFVATKIVSKTRQALQNTMNDNSENVQQKKTYNIMSLLKSTVRMERDDTLIFVSQSQYCAKSETVEVIGSLQTGDDNEFITQ